MKCLIYIALFYIAGRAFAVDVARPQRGDFGPVARFNQEILNKWKESWEPRHSDDPVPGLIPDDSDDEDDPYEPKSPKYN